MDSSQFLMISLRMFEKALASLFPAVFSLTQLAQIFLLNMKPPFLKMFLASLPLEAIQKLL